MRLSADEGRGAEQEGEHAERDCHSGRSGKQQWLASYAVHQGNRDEGGRNVGHARDDGDQQRVLHREPDTGPENARVIEDDVDTDQLLEKGKSDSDPHHRQESVAPIQQIFQSRMRLGFHGPPDLVDLG